MTIKVSTKITKDTFFTLVSINWLLRISNLSCVYRKENQLKVSWSLTKTMIYISTLGFINFSILIYRIQNIGFVSNSSACITFSDTTELTYLIGYIQYIIDLIYVHKYGTDSFLKYFESFNHIDQILGMTYYDEIRKIISKTVKYCIIMFVVISLFDYVIWVEGYGWISPTLYTLDYFHFFLNMLSAFDGISHIVQLEYRLKMMKDLIQSYYNSTNCIKSISDDNKLWAVKSETKNNRLESLRTVNYGQFMEVNGFNHCYLLLLQQTCYTNSKFGFRVLIFCINLLINMINLLNITIRFANGSMVSPSGVTRLPALCGIIRFVNWAIVGFIIVHRCEYTYRQSEDILKIIDLLIINNKSNSNNLTTSLADLRNLLLTRPIQFHGLNFFTIDYPLLVSLASTVVTYTIILLQNLQDTVLPLSDRRHVTRFLSDLAIWFFSFVFKVNFSIDNVRILDNQFV